MTYDPSGALTVVVHEGQELTPVEERLFAGLAAQSGLMLRVAGLRAELEQQLAGLERRTEELRKARRDLVTRQDAERQRLERNIHDGAQQEVIALLVNLRLAQALLTRAPERGARLLAEQAAASRATIDTLTALSRGTVCLKMTSASPWTRHPSCAYPPAGLLACGLSDIGGRECNTWDLF